MTTESSPGLTSTPNKQPAYYAAWQRGDERVREDISQETFNYFKAIRLQLIAALDIEENYNGLIERYHKFQKELLDVLLSTTVTYPAGWDHLRVCSQRLDRELISLFSAARQYIDQSAHLYKITEVEEAAQVQTWFSIEYDARLGYRVCEALRNVSQHRLLPTQSLTVGGEWRDKERGVRTHSMKLYLRPAVLVEDEKFKRSVLRELTELGEKTEVVPLLREYLNGLATVNGKIRASLENPIDEWSSRIRAFLKDRLENLDHDAVYLLGSHGAPPETDRVPLFNNLVKRLDKLRRHNSSGERAFDYEVVL